jgi:hypothetical protein
MDNTRKQKQTVHMFFDLSEEDVYINYHDHIQFNPGAHPKMVSKLKLSNSGIKGKNYRALMNCLIKNHIMIQKQRKTN